MKLKLVAVAVAALAPVVAMLAYNEVAIRHQRNEEVRAEAAQAAREAASEVERIVEGLQSLLISVRAMPSIRDLDAAGCSASLQSVASQVPNIGTIFVLGPQGRMVCGSMQPSTADFSDRDYFKKVMETKSFAVGTYTKSRISDSPVLPVALPLIEAGSVKAVIVTGVRLEWLQNRLTARGVVQGNAVTIADSEGTILARAPFPEKFVGTVMPQTYKPLMHAAEPGVLEIKSQDGTERVMGYQPISLPTNPLYVSAGFSRDEAFAPINRATLINSLAIVGGAILSFFAAVFIGNRFLVAPVADIAGVMERWRRGEAGARTGMTGRDEIASVGAALDRLLNELEERRRLQVKAEDERELLSRELAHRIKNGFALVQTMARQTFRPVDAERYRTFETRLSALAGTYDLLLARDAGVSTVHDIVANALRAHAEPGSDRIIVQGPDIALPPDLGLPLSLVIHELATNATKYGSLGSEAGQVSVTWKHDGTRILLNWTESGGPPVRVPEKKGFGSVLIERAFPAQASALCRTDYRAEGLAFELAFALSFDRGAHGDAGPG